MAKFQSERLSSAPPSAAAESDELGAGGKVEEEEEGRLLDGFLLLAAGGASAPEDVVSVNLSTLNVIDVADDDLAYFVHLDRLDLSDNRLSYPHVLQQMARLPRLTTLSLACNSISSLEVAQEALLENLQALDLSYNELQGEVLAQLSLLPNLATLNLTSNCISSAPLDREAGGFPVLHELILDNNDLVQFEQWRALDALPRLRKLSLASNRIRRLKDDDSTPASWSHYFPALEELDLSSNEIATAVALPVLQLFRCLRVVKLSHNPCMQRADADSQTVPGVNVHAEKRKEWYLTGTSGCFQKQVPSREPKLKLNRRKLRRVRSQPHVGAPARQRNTTQLCVYNEEANELLISMQGVPPSSAPTGGAQDLILMDMARGGAGDNDDRSDDLDLQDGIFASTAPPGLGALARRFDRGRDLSLDLGGMAPEGAAPASSSSRREKSKDGSSRRGRSSDRSSRKEAAGRDSDGQAAVGDKKRDRSTTPAGPTAVAAVPVLHDELSETELAELFRERRQKIEREFNEPVEEPVSFMKNVPQAMRDSIDKKLDRIRAVEGQTSTPAAPGARPSSLFGADGAAAAQVGQARAKRSSSQSRQSRRESPAAILTGAAGLTLPPLPPGSRGSSAAGSGGYSGGRNRAGSGTGDALGGGLGSGRGNASGKPVNHLTGLRPEMGGNRPQPVAPDADIFEAFNALRAAQLSEYAVAPLGP